MFASFHFAQSRRGAVVLHETNRSGHKRFPALRKKGQRALWPLRDRPSVPIVKQEMCDA